MNPPVGSAACNASSLPFLANTPISVLVWESSRPRESSSALGLRFPKATVLAEADLGDAPPGLCQGLDANCCRLGVGHAHQPKHAPSASQVAWAETRHGRRRDVPATVVWRSLPRARSGTRNAA